MAPDGGRGGTVIPGVVAGAGTGACKADGVQKPMAVCGVGGGADWWRWSYVWLGCGMGDRSVSVKLFLRCQAAGLRMSQSYW